MTDFDPLEQKLSSLPLRQLPSAWRAEILGAATASTMGLPKRRGPPVWLAWTWGAALAASIVLSLLTPGQPVPTKAADAAPAPAVPLHQRAELLNALLADNDRHSSFLLP